MTTVELGYWVLAAAAALALFGAIDKRRAVVRARRAARLAALDASVRRHPAGNLR